MNNKFSSISYKSPFKKSIIYLVIIKFILQTSACAFILLLILLFEPPFYVKVLAAMIPLSLVLSVFNYYSNTIKETDKMNHWKATIPTRQPCEVRVENLECPSSYENDRINKFYIISIDEDFGESKEIFVSRTVFEHNSGNHTRLIIDYSLEKMESRYAEFYTILERPNITLVIAAEEFSLQEWEDNINNCVLCKKE